MKKQIDSGACNDREDSRYVKRFAVSVQGRAALVNMLPTEFWDDNKEYIFKFLDG